MVQNNIIYLYFKENVPTFSLSWLRVNFNHGESNFLHSYLFGRAIIPTSSLGFSRDAKWRERPWQTVDHVIINTRFNSEWGSFHRVDRVEQEILKNLQAADSLSPPPPPSPLPKKKKRLRKVSTSWFLVTCYGQFALPVCRELLRPRKLLTGNLI